MVSHGLKINTMPINVNLSKVSEPHCFVFLQHLANLRDVLFAYVEFDIVGGDWLFIFTHMFRTLIGKVAVNHLDVPGVVITFLIYVTLVVLAFRQKS